MTGTLLSNYIHIFRWNIITYPYPNNNRSLTKAPFEVSVWLNNDVSSFYVDEIIYPRSFTDSGLATVY